MSTDHLWRKDSPGGIFIYDACLDTSLYYRYTMGEPTAGENAQDKEKNYKIYMVVVEGGN